jgi:hypothetical protein
VASTGEFLVTWNFQKVKKGSLREYQIRRIGERTTGPMTRSLAKRKEEGKEGGVSLVEA